MMDYRVFDSLLEPTFVIDREGRVLYCNEAASLICDLSVRKIMRSKMKLTEIFKFNEKIEAVENPDNVTEASPYQEVSFETESGKQGRVQLTLQAFGHQPAGEDDGTGEPQWLLYFRDVTLEETLQRKYRAELGQKESVISDLERAQAQLEEYSKNLEKMVAERTAQLTTINGQMKALLDSLGQGFLIFDRDGLCQQIASKACETILEGDPRGKKIFDVLKMDASAAKSFGKWMVTAFEEMLPFEDLAPLAPNRFAHSEAREIDTSYYPLRADDGSIVGIVLVATDITDLVSAQRTAQEERAHAQMIIQLVQNKRQVLGFMREADSILHELAEELRKAKPNQELTFRLLHTLKGGAASFHILDLAEKTHAAEDALAAWSKSQSADDLTYLIAQASGILKSYDAFLDENAAILGSRKDQEENLREVSTKKMTAFYLKLAEGPEKREFFENFMLEPAASQFHHFNDVVQSTAVQTGKIVEPLEIATPDFCFWPEVYQGLVASLVHGIRNAVDHGIESPDHREAHGKNAAGHIRLSAERQNELLILKLQDDGAGIDAAKIRARSLQKGIDLGAASDHEAIQQVFGSEFSTREQVTEISGRGVGMDAIMIEARKLGGRAWVESVVGQGTCLTIAVPWLETLADLSKGQNAA